MGDSTTHMTQQFVTEVTSYSANITCWVLDLKRWRAKEQETLLA
jgi:hypothetical protein